MEDILSPEFDDAFDRIAAREAAARANGQGHDLPPLVVTPSNLTATAQALARVFAENHHFLSNGNAPVAIVVEDNAARAIAVTPDIVRIAAHRLCRPVKAGEKKGEFFDVTLSKDIAQLYLYGMAGDWGLRPLRGITTAPILEADGTIRVVEGYDVRSGLYCHNVPKITVPELPNEVDAGEALFRLRDYLKTFPYADSIRTNENRISVVDLSKEKGMDESTLLALLLTAVVRQSIALAPGALLAAPELSGSGTGKGMLIKILIVIATGIIPTAMTGRSQQGGARQAPSIRVGRSTAGNVPR
jgi:hypothetical protein